MSATGIGVHAADDCRKIAPAQSGMDPPRAVWVVVIGATAVAAAVGAVLIRPPFQWPTLLMAGALIGLLETGGTVPMDLGPNTKIWFSAKAYASVGATYLLGPAAAVAAVIPGAVISVRTHKPIKKTIFNAAMGLLTFTAAFEVFSSIRDVARHDILTLLLGGALGGVAAWITNESLLGLVLAAEQGVQRFRTRAFVLHVLPLIPYYIGYGLTGLGVFAASYWLGGPAALVTLAAPVAIVQTTTNRWLREQGARLAEAKDGFNATLISLSKAIDLRDKETEGHCRRVVEYSLLMGRHLKFSEDELIRLCHGALLHDIGKIGVPDAILHKPGPLTDNEWATMRTHPELGALMVVDVKQLEKARQIILNHHERFDGKGYPRGLSGSAVPLEARLFTIADAFDAMISDRPYRKAMSLQDARDEVRRCAGTQFDPTCVAAFDSISDEELLKVINKREQPTEELLSLKT